MLDPEFKEKWCAALESGQYPQTTSVLYDGHGFCCLGVACVVLGATFVERNEDEDEPECLNYRPMLNDEQINSGSDEVIDDEIAEAKGLTLTQQADLYTLNDKGTPFPVIADYIRKNL